MSDLRKPKLSKFLKYTIYKFKIKGKAAQH